jgi:coenzyme F420-reducing hydrogenase beta subunit
MENRSISAPSNIECCGCGVCAVICPLSCVELSFNRRGFYNAVVDDQKCNQCGLCQPVCFKFQDRYPLTLHSFINVYTAYNNNDTIRFKSPSGGVGTALSETAMEMGYRIIGAKLDPMKMDLRHVVIADKGELEIIRGSKYFQSFTPDAFSAIKKDEKLLVFGTPCQISGIRKMIAKRKGFEHILLVDFKCAGVPSRLLVDIYFEHLQQHYQSPIRRVNLRYKEPTWANFSVKIDFENGSSYSKVNYFDALMKFYRTAACISNFCADCNVLKNYSHADIRIEDAWDFVPLNTSDYKKGLNTVVTFTPKGAKLFESAIPRLHVKKQQLDYASKSITNKKNKPEIIALLKENPNLHDFVKRGMRLEPRLFMRWYFTALLKTYLGRITFPVYCFLRRRKANRAMGTRIKSK